MNNRYVLLLLFCCLATSLLAQSNPGFEQGFKGWHNIGNVSIDKSNAHQGLACAKIESGSLFVQVPVAPLAIINFDCYVKSGEKGVKGYSFVRFYNSKRRKLLEYKDKTPDSIAYQQTGNYTEAPPNSAYMEIGIEKDAASAGVIYADDFSIQANALPYAKKKHYPTVNLDEYMRPFWQSDTICNETVLLYSVNGELANGKLLFMPDDVLSIKSYDLKTTYQEGKDYALAANTITRTANSAMPYRADTSFDTKKDLAWFNTQSQWVVVTYTHHDQWNGPVPAYKGDRLPNTLAKLRAKKPLKIVAYGMSITRGMDVSAFDTIAPYMPTYVGLFARQLRKSYHDADIKLYNAGLPGSTVDWAAQYANQYVNPLKPDLVVLDFGMNDFWRLTPDQFKGYIETIMRKAKAANPGVEFLLIANMKFDPGYVLDSDKYKSFYTGNLEGYSKVLTAMEKKGVICLDMFTESDELYTLKKPKDCLANPLHPNDYLARWYAQSLSALLIKSKRH